MSVTFKASNFMLENDVVRHKGTMHVGAAKRIETKK